jgi:hypothetical protein
MDNVSFNEPQYRRNVSSSAKPSFLSNLVIRMGLAKDPQGAQRILFILFVIAAVAAIIVIWTGSGSSVQLNPDVPA